MPAINMASAGGSQANVSAMTAAGVIADPFSGPVGSVNDARVITGWNYSGASLGMPIKALASVANNADGTVSSAYSTGALSTGIGFGTHHVVSSPFGSIAGGNVVNGSFGPPSFTDDYQPGISLPSGASILNTVPTPPAQTPYGAVLLAIGGGNSNATANGIAVTNPYTLQPILAFGLGGARDAGAGPIFTGFGTKMVTATGAVLWTAPGVAIEAGWINRTGYDMTTGQSAFGSATAASPIVASTT